MDVKSWTIFFFILPSVIADVWGSSEEDRKPYKGARKNIHYHSKRHMAVGGDPEMKKRITSREVRDMRKKPTGHLTPLQEEDIDNDEVISVAIAPPPARPKFERNSAKTVHKHNNHTSNTSNPSVTNLVKDVLHQLGAEFLTHHVGEDFIFGQYLAVSMKNLTSEIKLRMQHDVLELIMKYQKLNHKSHSVNTNHSDDRPTNMISRNVPKEVRLNSEKKIGTNDTEEAWPDFSNLQTIVGN